MLKYYASPLNVVDVNMEYHLIILLALSASSFAGPTRHISHEAGSSSCSKACTGSNKLGYAPGTTYQYKYEAETRTSVLGASEDHSAIWIKAIVDIEVVSKCEFILQVNDVTIVAYDSQKYADQDKDREFARTLEKFPLRFSFQDGRIESVCPFDREEPWAVNIKKGILSSLQNSMDSFDFNFKGSESDVTGKCETEYTVAQRGWRTLTIKKSKDLSTCSHRQGFDSAIQTTPFRVSSGIKSLPIMKETHTCDQEVSIAGHLVSSICHEMHLLRPFSKENSGASTEVTQKMTFVKERAGTNNHLAKCGEPEELYFEHSPSTVSTDLSAKDALDLLMDLCDSTASEVTPATSDQFSTLISTMKRIDTAGLNRIYNQVMRDGFCPENQERVRRFYIDAIPMVGTESSIQLMKTLISNDDITGSQADIWLASIAFVQHPTKEMIKYIQELIGLPSLSYKVLLPLSAMVQSYCKVTPSCEQVKEIQDFIDILTRNIDGGCQVDQKNFKTIMMTLRAIGNTGHAEMAVPALYSCIEGDNSMDIKVAAIQAFRKLSCATDRNNLMGIYRDTSADSEIRINAYLAVMKCPSPYIISQIQETLTSGEVNQVGSFVWSHLTNLMESSDPSNKYVQGLLEDAEFDEKFDLDKMKFSRNYEGSFYLEKYNTGAMIDSNLIWSSKSFVPRSGSLNLTVNLFGESMNLFEVGGRVEGLESMLESYFGPVGYYNDDTKRSNDIPEADPRLARLSKKKMDDIRDKAKRTMDELRGAMYMRMFGSEVSYMMFGANNGVDYEKFTESQLFDFLQKLRNNKKQELALTRNIMLVDSTYTVPTVVGLPLKLQVNGSATVALNVGGQADIKNPRQSIAIEGNFEPSGSVKIDSMMSVDAVVTRGGLKMASSLYTSTGARGKIEVTGGNVFDLSFDVTKEKSEILDVKSTFYVVYNDKIKEQKMLLVGSDQEEKLSCSKDRMLKATGIELCASYLTRDTKMKSDAPNFPLTGPVSFTVTMNKKDLPNGYKLEVKTIKTPVQTLFRFLSDTPGSQYDRAIGLDVDVKHSEKTLDIMFVSPWKKASVTGQLIDTSSVKGLLGNINIDGSQRIYDLDARILIDQSKDRITYTPNISVDIQDWKKISLTGGIIYKLKKSLEADFLITGALDTSIEIQTSILNTDTMIGMKGKLNYTSGEGYVFEAITQQKIEKKKLRSRYTYEPRVYVRTPDEEMLEFSGSSVLIPGKSFKAIGSLDKLTKIPYKFNVDLSRTEYTKKKRVKSLARVSVTGPRLSNKLMIMHDNKADKNIFTKYRLDYSIGKQWRDTLMGNTRVKMNIAKNKKIVKIASTLNSVKNDNLDAALAVNYLTNRYKTNLDCNLKYGKAIKSKTSKETIDLSVAAKHRDERVVEYASNLKFPAKNIDVTISGDNTYGDKEIQSNIQVKYHPERNVAFSIHLHNRTDLFFNYAGELVIKLPQNRELSFAGGFGKENDNKYISNLEFEIIKGRRTRIDTMLKIATQKMYEFEIGVRLPELDPVRMLGSYTKEENGHSVEASYKKGNNLYRIFVEGAYEKEVNGKFLFDVTVPSRRVKVNIVSSRVDTKSHMLFDVQWNADKNLDDRFLTNLTSDFVSWDDFEIAYLLHYPTRTINFDMKHSAAARYITNIELSWSPKEKLEFNIIFRDDKFNGDDRTELAVDFISPFKGYEELGLAVSLIRDSAQFQTKSSVTWAKKKKVLVSATTKVPFDINSIDIAGTISTPFEDFRTLTAKVKHRLNDELDSNILIEWGRKRLSLITSGTVKYNKISRSLNGKIDFRSPFEGLRAMLINAEHNDDSKTFKTKFTTHLSKFSSQVSMDKYILEMDMTHDNSIIGLKNQGEIKILIPNDDIPIVWEVSRLSGSSRIMLDIQPMRGNRFKFDIGETHQLAPSRKLSSSFEFLIPTEVIQELLISFNHEDKPGYVRTAVSVFKDNLDIMSAEVNFQNLMYGTVKVNSNFKSVYTDDLILKFTSAHSIMPYISDLELRYGDEDTPYQVTAESSIFYNEFGVYENSLKICTPFPGFNKMTIKTNRERQGFNWNTKSEVSIDDKKISIGITYRIDHVKLTSLSIKSTFPQFPGLDTSFSIDGGLTKLSGDASFIMKPYVDKISSDFKWSFYQGTSLDGVFNLYTPFPQYPYMKAKVNSNVLGMSRVSGFEIEYLPTQVVKVVSDYRYTSLETLEGTIKVTSPYTNNKEVTAGFTHIGNRREFKTEAKITCECFRKPVFTEATFSSKNGVVSAFNMNSPFRGYESVKWNLNHRGNVQDFSTKAEYETNGKKITFVNMFSMHEDIQYRITFLTPFANISRSHLVFKHEGKFPNTKTHAEVGYNENIMSSDIDLKNNRRATVFNVEIKTPFKRYENINLDISRAGSLNDFTAKAEIQYDRLWHASLKHRFDNYNLATSSVLKSPYLPNDVSLSISHNGKPLDFITKVEYTLGPGYRTSGETKFIYDLPNLTASSKFITNIGKETRVNEISLAHEFIRKEDTGIDISTTFLAQIREKQAKADFKFKFLSDKDEQIERDISVMTYFIVEAPHQNFSYNKIFYDSSMKITDLSQTQSATFSFETPMLEKAYYSASSTVDKMSINSNAKYSYGDYVWTYEQTWQHGKYHFKGTIPLEGYEETEVDFTYGGNLFDRKVMASQPDFIDWDFDTVITQTSLDTPAKVYLYGNFNRASMRVKSINNNVKVLYGLSKEVNVVISYKPEKSVLKITTPFEGYESSELETNYITKDYERDYSLSVTSSALELPIEMTSHLNLNPTQLKDFEIYQKFTSGFTNFTHIEVAIKAEKLRLLWEDSKMTEQVIEIEGPTLTKKIGNEEVEVGMHMAVTTPFKELEDMKVNIEHRHFTSPMRAKEIIFVQYNGKKYFDVDAEVGALNKFSGSLMFREPRQMEFSFSGLNEGQSVNGDLVLNWNKLDQRSNFRFQFGLADSGDMIKEKKVFHIRITNPTGRILSLYNNFERTENTISSSGKFSWDEKERKETAYDLNYSRLFSRGSTLHSSDLKIILPARSVEMSASYTNNKGQVVSTGTVMWDSENNRDKQVQVKVTVSPTDVRKMAELNIKLPSMNKDLSVSTDIALNDGSRLLDGQTKLSYSPDENKAVLIKYIIQKENNDQPSYKAGWSLDHIYTSTHVAMVSILSSDDAMLSGDVELKYRGADKQLTALELHAEVDKNERKMNIKATSPSQSAEVVGHITSESPYTFMLTTSRNMKPTWKTVWSVDTESRTLDASMTYDDFKGQIVTRASFPNSTTFESETTRQTSSDTVQEGHMSMIQEDRKVNIHLKWRPQLISEAANYGSEALQQMRNEMGPVMNDGMKDMGNVLLQKHRLISTSINDELSPVSDGIEEEMKSVQQDLRKMRRELKKMYKQNDLYLRTIEETYSGSVKAMLAGYSAAILKLEIAYNKAQEAMEELSNRIDQYPFKERYNAMMNTLSEKIRSGEIIVKDELEVIFSVLTEKVEEFANLYDDSIKEISNQIRTMIEVLLDELALSPYIDDVKAAYNKIIESNPGLDNTEVLKIVNEVQQMLLESMEKSTFIEKYKALYEHTNELLSEKFGEVMANKDIQEMNKAILDLYERVSWLYKYTEINVSLRELAQDIHDAIRSKVMENFNDLPLGLLDLHKSKVITFDLQKGEIEFDLYLPMPMENLDSLMKMTYDRYKKKVKALADKYFPRRDICLSDFYYRLPHVRWSMSKDWTPPFDVFGTVSGKQHFTTFDGHHYDVSGLCSYILAQDVVTNNFSVVLRYTGGPRTLAKESLVAILDGKVVEMLQNYMVKVDGQPTELPYRSDRLTIVRTGNTVTLDSSIGLTLVSDFIRDYHIVGLSGWYYGKVGGLLGNIDNEPNNDLATPEGETGHKLRKFLNSWEVDSSCKSTMAYVENEPRVKSKECAAVFDESSSSLRPCFLQVKPQMYEHSCNIDPTTLCDIAKLYTETCHRHGITVNIPNSCVKCETHNSVEYSSDEPLKYEQRSTKHLHNSMDVVFVVEERQCNKDISDKLKNVIYRLEQSLTKSGSSDNQYSLVGYAGSIIDSHTMEGQLFNDATKFAMGLENLKFNNLGPYTDPLSAVEYASKLPFRTAVKKTVILVSCSPCEEANGYSFSRLLSELQTLDISLHVLRQQGFHLTTNRSPKSQIFGIDNDEAFFGQRRGDNDVFSNLEIPLDFCSSLALNTSGSIFDSGNMLVGNVRQQRRFMDSFSDRVQQKESMCQICSCELDQYGNPRSVCRRCDRQPLLDKPITKIVQRAVDLKNSFSQKLQALLF